MLQLSLKLQEAADGEFSLQVFSKEVCGESGAAAGGLQRVSGGGAVAVPHAHAGLGSNDALDLQRKDALQRIINVKTLPKNYNYGGFWASF